MKNIKDTSRQGYIALFTVIIIVAVVITISATVSLLSIGEAQSSFSLYKGEENLQFVEGCVEDGLLKSRNDPSYNGGTITRPEGTCTILPISKVGSTWTMTVTADATAQYKRSVQTVFTRTGTGVQLVSWKEVAL